MPVQLFEDIECYVSPKYLTDLLLPETDWICYREWNTVHYPEKQKTTSARKARLSYSVQGHNKSCKYHLSLTQGQNRKHSQWTTAWHGDELISMWLFVYCYFPTWLILIYLKVRSPSASRGLENLHLLNTAYISDTVIRSQLGALPSTRGREQFWLLQ